MLAGTANLPSRRRKLNCVNAPSAAQENSSNGVEPMQWFPISAVPESSSDHDGCFIKVVKRVGFHDPVVSSVRILENLTEEEHSRVWYSRQEYSALQLALRSAVKLFRSSNWTVTSKGQCRRGLEKYQLHYERKRMERQHFDAILSEQRRQREMGILDAELLRQASLVNSSWALKNAQRTAQNDVFACQQHLQHLLQQQQQQQQQRNAASFPSQHQIAATTTTTPNAAATTTTVKTAWDHFMESCSDNDDDDNDEQVDMIVSKGAAVVDTFQHLPSLFVASRRPTPPPPLPKKPTVLNQTGNPTVTTTPNANPNTTATVVALA